MRRAFLPVVVGVVTMMACGARRSYRGLGLEDLRLAVVVSPGDAGAHAALGEVLARGGLPGAAIRELEIARRHGETSGNAVLARLLVARARQREALGDFGRWRDWDEAVALAPGALGEEGRRERDRALVEAGRARLAAADDRGASELLRRVRARSSPATQPAGAPCGEDADALAALQRAIRRDPAVAGRLARDYADAEPSLLCRGPVLVKEYLEAEDPARALAWAAEVLGEAPDDTATAIAAATAAARLHDVPRAELYREQAEYAAAEHGGAARDVSRELAEVYLRVGEPLAALSAARRVFALAKTAEERVQGTELVVAAQLAAGRPDDARALLSQMMAELPPAERLASATRIRKLLPPGIGDAVLGSLAPEPDPR